MLIFCELENYSLIHCICGECNSKILSVADWTWHLEKLQCIFVKMKVLLQIYNIYFKKHPIYCSIKNVE